MKVRRCFGRYGDMDLDKIEYNRFIKKFTRTPYCTMLCKNFLECKNCYYLWYKFYRPREEKIKFIIQQFMAENNLKFYDENYQRYFKKNKI